jgi:hypothetical protein
VTNTVAGQGAGFKGNAEAVHILFEAGCDPSEMGADGFTPIHRACWGGEKEHTTTGAPHRAARTNLRGHQNNSSSNCIIPHHLRPHAMETAQTGEVANQ